jgi:hypothetical protein
MVAKDILKTGTAFSHYLVTKDNLILSERTHKNPIAEDNLIFHNFYTITIWWF